MSTHPLTDRSPSIPLTRPAAPPVALALSLLCTVLIPLAVLLVLDMRGLNISRPLYGMILGAVLLDALVECAGGLTHLGAMNGPAIPRSARWLAGWRGAYRWLSPEAVVLGVFWLGWERIGLGHPRDLAPLATLVVLWLLLGPTIRWTFDSKTDESDRAHSPNTLLRHILYLDTLERSRMRAAELRQIIAFPSPANTAVTGAIAVADDEILNSAAQLQTPPAVPEDRGVTGIVASVAIATPAGVPAVRAEGDARADVEPEPVQTDAPAGSRESLVATSCSISQQALSDARGLVGLTSTLTSRLARQEAAIVELEQRVLSVESMPTGVLDAAWQSVWNVPTERADFEPLLAAVSRLAANPGSLLALGDVSAAAGTLIAITRAMLKVQQAAAAPDPTDP